MQIGCSNIGMIKPAAHFGEVIRDGERSAPGDFNAPHRKPSLSSAGERIIAETETKG